MTAISKLDVLDHGYVRLVDHMGDDLSIVRNARNSYDAAWRTGVDKGSDHNLINYLMRNRHTTPFEAVQFTFEVKAPLFVFRQWHRHRTWTYNEVSARYTELPEEFYIPKPEHIGTQSVHNKQVRDILPVYTDYTNELVDYEVICRSAFTTYHKLLSSGWPRELARMCLPLSTYSRMFASVDLHNLLHFLHLRLHPHAQYEIRVYAEALLSLITPVVPVAVEAWKEHNNND